MIAAGFEPLEPYSGNNAPWRCRCVVCQRESTPAYGSAKKGHGCAWCAGLRVDPAEAHVVMAAANLEPLEPYPGSDVAWRCRCLRCNNIVAPRYNGVRQGKRCRICAGNVTDERRFHGVMIAAGLEPMEPYPGRNNKPWRSRCRNCEREVSPTYANVSMGKGCAYCSNNRVDPTEATAFMIEVGLQPLEPYPGSNERWRCRCTTCKREVSPAYVDAHRTGSGCAYCSKRRVDPTEATAFMIEVGLQPLEPYPGAGQPWRCRCTTCNREVSPLYGRVQNGSGCAYCARIRVDPTEATAFMIEVGLQPLEPYPGAGQPWRCRCTTCNREVSPTYGTIKVGGGCRFCAPRGIDYTAPGIVYLMHHPEMFVLKVGVSTTAAKNVRVDTHAKTGWVTISTWDTPTGDAEQIEQQILGWWRNELGAPPALTKTEMPTGGWSETAALIHVDIDDTINRINRLVAASHAATDADPLA